MKSSNDESLFESLDIDPSVDFNPEQVEALDKRFSQAYQTINQEFRTRQAKAVEESTKIYLTF